jgi:hypothetical protein
LFTEWLNLYCCQKNENSCEQTFWKWCQNVQKICTVYINCCRLPILVTGCLLHRAKLLTLRLFVYPWVNCIWIFRILINLKSKLIKCSFLQIYFPDSNLGVIEMYSLPENFYGLLIFFVCRGSLGYEMLFLLFPM